MGDIDADLILQVLSPRPHLHCRRGFETMAADASVSASSTSVGTVVLPIKAHEKQLIQAVRAHQCIVVTGETGCGKTTQLPQYLHKAGFSETGVIGVTQPRRMAAISVAHRVAEELGCSKVGSLVGYQVRFDDCTSSETKIKYMTDGCLLRELLEDSSLSRYSLVVLDEAHERSLATDILFGLVKAIMERLEQEDSKRQSQLKVVIMSATLDVSKFSLFFNSCPVLTIPGRVFPVDIHYCCSDESYDYRKPTYLSQVVRVVMDIHLDHPPGDILVFLTGQAEIESVCEKLYKAAENIDYRFDVQSHEVVGLAILPLYGSLPSEQQQRVFLPGEKGVRRVIVSTNIAATSVTVDGIVYVIDCGFVKQLVYSARTGLDILDIVSISKSEASQRTGRAGRTAPGMCYRLYSRQYYEELREDTVPEIQRASLTSVVLNLKCMGITNVIEFCYLDPPEERMILEALRQLYYYQAIDIKGLVTLLGKQMVEFPLEPSLSRVLLRAKQLQCQMAALPIIAMLSVENVFIRPASKEKAEEAAHAHRFLAEAGGGTSDFATLLAIYKLSSESGNMKKWCSQNYVHWRAIRTSHSIYQQLAGTLSHQHVQIIGGTSTPVSERLRQALCYGLFGHAARLAPGRRCFNTMDGHGTVAYIHPSSVLFGREPSLDWVVYHELVDTAKTYMRTVCPIRYAWIQDLLPLLHDVDVYKLSDCERKRKMSSIGEGQGEEEEDKCEADKCPTVRSAENKQQLQDRAGAARQRYLARKRAKTQHS